MNALAPLLLVTLAVTTAAPAGDAFYTPPSPLSAGTHGDVIWSRPLTGAGVLSNAATNTLVLYHTVAVGGRDVAVSGALSIPRGDAPADGWPIVSWAHGTTGNAPECAPTRAGEANLEQRYLRAWIARGFAVAQTDYEGQGTPGLHPYLVGEAAAHDVTDIVRAARRLEPTIGTHWLVLGHSEGGSAAMFTAALGPAWAPELHLDGAVAFAPVTHIASIARAMPITDRPIGSLPVVLEMIEGIGSTDPSIHLDELLTAQAFARLPTLNRRCVGDVANDSDFMSLAGSDIFRHGIDIKPLVLDFLKNEANRIHTTVPLLLMQGAGDDLVLPRVTSYVDRELCANGSTVTYEELPKKTHDSIVTDSLTEVQAWIDARESRLPATLPDSGTKAIAPAPVPTPCN